MLAVVKLEELFEDPEVVEYLKVGGGAMRERVGQ